MKNFLLYFLLILLVAQSCSKPEDEPATPGSARITINNFPDDADTISAIWHSWLNVSITGAQFPKYVLKVFDVNTRVYWDSSYTGTFQVSTDRIYNTTGFYHNRFEVYGGQSSQTFLQILNNGLLINKRLVVTDFSGYNMIPEPILAEKNGTLEGSFNTNLRTDALAVYRFYNYYNMNVRVDSVMATGNGEVIFTDRGYVGEKTDYSLKGYSYYDSTGLIYTGAGNVNKALEISPHEVYSDADGSPIIRWNKNRYHQNFGSYRIRKQKGSSGGTVIKEITDINDTLQTAIDLGFPGAVNIFVTHLPKENLQYIKPELEMADYGHKVAYKPGNPIRPYDAFESPRGEDVYLYQDNEAYVYRYSAATFQKVDSIYCPSGRFAVSANNKYVLTLRSDRFHLYNVVTQQDISIFISDFLPVAAVNDFDVSDIGTITVMNDFDSLKLIDVLNNHLLGTLPMSNYTLNLCQISPEGEYVYVFTEYKYRVYRYSGGTFTEVFNIGATGFNSLKFIADQSGKVLLIRQGRYEIYDLVSGSTLFSASLMPAHEICIDFNEGLILTTEEYFLRIQEISTGTVLKSIVHNIDYANPHKTMLHGYTLFNGIGRWMTVRIN